MKQAAIVFVRIYNFITTLEKCYFKIQCIVWLWVKTFHCRYILQLYSVYFAFPIYPQKSESIKSFSIYNRFLPGKKANPWQDYESHLKLLCFYCTRQSILQGNHSKVQLQHFFFTWPIFQWYQNILVAFAFQEIQPVAAGTITERYLGHVIYSRGPR